MMHSREKSDAAIVALAIVIRANFAELAQQSYSQLIRWSPLQWVIVALVKPLNVVAIEALVTDLHPGTQRAHGRKFLDGEPDRLGCGRKAAIAQLLSPTLALAHEQFGGYAVVERHSSRSAGFAFMLNPITEIDRKGLFGRQASARSATPTSTPTFPHLVELALPPGGFRSVCLEIDAFHRGRPSQYAAAGVDTRPSNSLFDSASQTPPLRMHSATASVANA